MQERTELAKTIVSLLALNGIPPQVDDAGWVLVDWLAGSYEPTCPREAGRVGLLNLVDDALWLDEDGRTDLMATIMRVVTVKDVSPAVHDAALAFVGWLARRHPSERPCETGVEEVKRQSMLPPPPLLAG